MILVYGYYPFPVTVRGGWMRRIAAVDALFAGRPRSYVFPAEPGDPLDYRLHQQDSLHTDSLPSDVRFYRPDLRYAAHYRRLTELIDEAEFVYAHTSHSAQHLLPYYRTGKIVTDLHGIAPEEERMQGAPERARFYESFEETMVRESAALVTVTQAMADHFRRKYPGLATRCIHLPILDEVVAPPAIERPRRAHLRVVYAGGLQRWQNIELMVSSAARASARYQFTFWTHEIEALHRVLDRHGLRARAQVSCEEPDRLGALYADQDLGFVLRDDDAVNRVSCPTKLTEYLAHGVIPIVSLVEIGDFATMGYRYVTLADFVADRLPDHDTLNAMRRHNRGVYERMRQAHAAGAQAVRELRGPAPGPALQHQPGLFLTSLERCCLPLHGVRLEIRWDDGEGAVLARDDGLRPARRVVTLPVAEKGPRSLVHLRWFPGAGPFVTSPMQVFVVDEEGNEHAVAVRGTHRVDRYGNWVFLERDGWIESTALRIPRARAVHIEYEVLLLGPETWITADGLQPAPTPVDVTHLRAELARAQADAATLRASFSWRVTEPARALARMFSRR